MSLQGHSSVPLTWFTYGMLESTVFIGIGYSVSGRSKVAGKGLKNWRVQLCNVTDPAAALRGRKDFRQFRGLVGILAATGFCNNTVGCKVPQDASQ